jgi:hypothetical protein
MGSWASIFGGSRSWSSWSWRLELLELEILELDLLELGLWRHKSTKIPNFQAHLPGPG